VLRQAEEVFRPMATRRGIQFTAAVPDGHSWVRADPLRISQVLGNLLGNAFKFTPENGAVSYGASLTGDDVAFAVKDTGPGIAPEQRGHLFEQFWQARNDNRGVGLGLAIAKGIVDAHGGRIWCEGELGAGTTFNFTLPLARATRSSDP
jgi:signal transduction histidine kinase